MIEFDNLVIFMSDGLRWDYHPEKIKKMGVTYRTIASSLHTPSSIASMLTGLYLPNHRIHGFTDKLSDETPTILDSFQNGGISSESGNFNNEIYNHLLDRYHRVGLSDIEEPFAWFMRDPGGHAPLDCFDDELGTTESVQSYLKRHAGDEEKLEHDYQRAVNSSIKRFEKHVLNVLEERAILDKTLIVFISDHGELLGEYGHVGESHPACPEVVQVPTTFIHPDISQKGNTGLMRHIDLPSSVSDLGNQEIPSTDGLSVFHPNNSVGIGLNFYDRPYPSFIGTFNYSLSSVWDWEGGFVFNDSSMWNRLKLLAGYLTKIPAGIQIKRSMKLEAFKLLLAASYSWGTPSFNKDEAKKMLEEWQVETQESPELDLDSETYDNLEDLGYL